MIEYNQMKKNQKENYLNYKDRPITNKYCYNKM